MFAKGESKVGFVIGILWEFPLAIFFATRLVRYHSFYDFLAFLVCFPSFLCVAIVGGFWARRSQFAAVKKYLDAFPKTEFEVSQLEPAVTTEDLNDLVTGLSNQPSGSASPNQREVFAMEIYLVRCVEPPIPNQIKCYPLMGRGPVIFLRDSPQALSAFGIFKLFHELGHAHPAGAVVAARAKIGILNAILTMIVVLGTAAALGSIWFGVVLGAFAWARVLGDIRRAEALQERIADAWAFRRLDGRIDCERALAMRRSQLEKACSQRGSKGSELRHALRWLRALRSLLAR